jgi:hypothetical protein
MQLLYGLGLVQIYMTGILVMMYYIGKLVKKCSRYK